MSREHPHDPSSWSQKQQEQGGSWSIKETKNAFGRALTSDEDLKALSESTQLAPEPAALQFRPLATPAAIQFSPLSGTFPSESSGYTILLWIKVDKFDEAQHLTLFGSYDRAQHVFLLVYIEKASQKLILQTSGSTSQASVRFKSFKFLCSQWYHVALVHSRQRATASARALLFVNGELIEQCKCAFPHPSPQSTSKSDPQASAISGSHARSNVSVFLGSPAKLSLPLVQATEAEWRLASCYLFALSLGDDLIAVHYRLGPEYRGNLQDRLGPFQTYAASASLMMRNELLHPGKEEKSDIVLAVRHRAGRLFPQESLLLVCSAYSSLTFETVESLSLKLVLSTKTCAQKLQQLTQDRRVMIHNSANSELAHAVESKSQSALVSGTVKYISKQSVATSAWCFAGCIAPCLHLIAQAKTAEQLLQCTRILLGLIGHDWRNSETTERENGYGLLSAIWHDKLGLGVQKGRRRFVAVEGLEDPNKRQSIMLQLLTSVLSFLGCGPDAGDEALIANPLAYRILLIDLDVWRKGSEGVQNTFYGHFNDLTSRSKYAYFNNRRLARMRVTKRFLETLQSQEFSRGLIPTFVRALRPILTSSTSSEHFRALALFVTAELQRGDRNQDLLREDEEHHGSHNRPTDDQTRSRTKGRTRRNQGHITPSFNPAISVLELLSKTLYDGNGVSLSDRFAKSVSIKWVLYLLSEDDPRVVVLATRLLACLLASQGTAYLTKFIHKTGGFLILKRRLRRWYNLTDCWKSCFAIFSGRHILPRNEREPSIETLVHQFDTKRNRCVPVAEALPVILTMLARMLKGMYQEERGQELESPQEPTEVDQVVLRANELGLTGIKNATVSDDGSGSLMDADMVRSPGPYTWLLSTIYEQTAYFDDPKILASLVQGLLDALYPIIVDSDPLSADVELNSHDITASVSFKGNDFVFKPSEAPAQLGPPPVVKAASLHSDSQSIQSNKRPSPLKRLSSFILITSAKAQFSPSGARYNQVLSPTTPTKPSNYEPNPIIQSTFDLLLKVFADQILKTQDFAGLGIFLKVPPGFQVHQVRFETIIMQQLLQVLKDRIHNAPSIRGDSKAIMNLARFMSFMADAVFEGWFVDGTDHFLDFTGDLLDGWLSPPWSEDKAVRLCSPAIGTVRTLLLRVILLKLSQLNALTAEDVIVRFMKRLTYWQTLLFMSADENGNYLRLVCYQLYSRLIDHRITVRSLAVELWRIIMVQKPTEMELLLHDALSDLKPEITAGFRKLLELDNLVFLEWVDEHRDDLDAIFYGCLSEQWEDHVKDENQRIEQSARRRLTKRRDRLKRWAASERSEEALLHQHDQATVHWRANILAAEQLKYHRSMQDQQDNHTFVLAKYEKLMQNYLRSTGQEPLSGHGWRLDFTEGRSRTRRRLLQNNLTRPKYQSRRRRTIMKSVSTSRSAHQSASISVKAGPGQDSTMATAPLSSSSAEQNLRSIPADPTGSGTDQVADEIEYELLGGAESQEQLFEDRHRKIMRSLVKGDVVQHVFNVARLLGMEGFEGLLIVGKTHLYLQDGHFQRADGEIVELSQAPSGERDPFLTIIAGQEKSVRQEMGTAEAAAESHQWQWPEIVSLSKRRFLFRDVAIELFFSDGESSLLTLKDKIKRDELWMKLVNRAPQTLDPSATNARGLLPRLDMVQSLQDQPQTLGSKLSNVFSQGVQLPATRAWVKGEISNFEYLMLLNTVAGRTLNDLTQYPVFPWVLASYTSKELDLSNPRTFRDLSKPMGCQSPSREQDFKERYKTFAEMGDKDAPPFHYGTHYSSAMIVTSWLIRMQPFVQSYLLMQGGAFDHPDRLFFSIEKAWNSAACVGMSDVRELIPEFFFLPEFLTNSNQFDFGLRQGGEAIDDVALPPWANGDPAIFIAKHREALESQYVSENLHQWIDLIFGCKQRGEAALEAVNVFHHLSYRGAKDLDEMQDNHERLATVGIIHNFGQTPNQIFHKPHPHREKPQHHDRLLDSNAEMLTRATDPVVRLDDRVHSIVWSDAKETIMATERQRAYCPPEHDRYAQWGYWDHSIRFFKSENPKPIGLFEQTQPGHITFGLFLNASSLITGGSDSVITIWNVTHHSKDVDMTKRHNLFGHLASITHLACSKSYAMLVSADQDGVLKCWNTNTGEFVRDLPVPEKKADAVVTALAVDDVTADIFIGRGEVAYLFSLNGAPLIKQSLRYPIISTTFHLPSAYEWLERNLIVTGHPSGLAIVWHKAIINGRFELIPVKQMDHRSQFNQDINIPAGISCVLTSKDGIWTGDEEGRVWWWGLGDGVKVEKKRRMGWR